ncbi:MAG: hypothetical protein CMO01_00345 [Thalassobius sp.]|nr:hypothetical protein [Thalassovita sp.]
MKVIRVLIYWHILLLPFCLKAQVNGSYFGAEATGLGGATSAFYSNSSVFNNTAGITKTNCLTTISSFQTKYAGQFNTCGIGVIFPIQQGKLAFSALRFGDKLYNEHKISAAYAFDLDGISLGFKTSLLQINATGYGSYFTPTFDFSIITQLSENLWLGGTANNFTQSGIRTAEREEKLASELTLGISYQPISKVILNVDAVKSVEFPLSVRVGFQYELTKNFIVRTGITGLEQNYHFGTSLKLKKIICDYALSSHPFLGLSHQLSFCLAFPNKHIKPDKNED